MAEPTKKLLVVEDEKNVGSTLVERLKEDGFDVTWAKTFVEADHEINLRKFHLALLDVGLPDGSGFDLAEKIREKSKATAIIFLTAFATPDDRIRGLELGAEDYVTKPFHLKELLLRIGNALKRAKFFTDLPLDEGRVKIGKSDIDFSKFEAVADGVTHSLTHKECALIKFLVERRGKVVSRDEILNFVWSESEFPTPRTVDNFILKIRKLVETDPENPVIIKSVRGVGYQLL